MYLSQFYSVINSLCLIKNLQYYRVDVPKKKTSCSIKSFIIFLIYNWSLGRKKDVHGKQKNYVSTCTVYLAISSYLLSSPAGSWSDWWHWWPESLGHWLGVGGDRTTWLCKFLHPPVVTKVISLCIQYCCN